LFFVPPGLALKNSIFRPHGPCVCFLLFLKQANIIYLYSINCLVFIAEMLCVYCAVRTES